MGDTEHALRAIGLSKVIVSVAEDGIASFERSIDHYPAEFKAIMWDAVAEIAASRAAAARRS